MLDQIKNRLLAYLFLGICIALLPITCIEVLAQEKLLAFPGAEGAGKYTSGGRGGIVYTVTNLNDDGPGSLRKGIRKKGPRIIVFAVSGYIDLQSQLVINNDDITIAGQSAPGQGICLRGYGLRINANNVIVRYLKIRPGDASQSELDALTGMRHKNIIVDHCSLSWATDEVCSLYENENFTLQWCLIAESLNESYHSKGNHGYGGIWGGQKATFHHNLLAHHTSRNPRLQGSRWHKTPEIEKAEIVNNVIYNWKSKSIYGGEAGNYKIVANYFKPGPATGDKASRCILEPYAPYSNFELRDNVVLGQEDIIENNNFGIKAEADFAEMYIVSQPIMVSDYQIENATDAYDRVLAHVGANLFRDVVDQRIINEVKNGTSGQGHNGIINSQEDVGGWPDIPYEKGPLDSDNDGMPDAWEISNGLNPNESSDAITNELNDHYTNIEFFLNSLIRNPNEKKAITN